MDDRAARLRQARLDAGFETAAAAAEAHGSSLDLAVIPSKSQRLAVDGPQWIIAAVLAGTARR